MSVSPEAAEIIRRKKSQYCRFADSNQWHLFDKIAFPDATFSFHGPDWAVIEEGGVNFNFSNREKFVAHFQEAFKTIQSIHNFGPGELEQVGPDEVKAIWTIIYHAGPKGTDAKHHATGGGHYHEIWKRQGDDWFMADLKFHRLYNIIRD